MMIDTHTHLFSKQFNGDRKEMIERALAAGIDKMLLPNIDKSSLPFMLECCNEFPSCLPMIGVHPCSIGETYREELDTVLEELQKGGYIAVGEIGLDYYWDITFKVEQKIAFRTQIEWAKKYKLPIAIHTRNSFEDAYEIVQEMKDENLSGVFHCFSGTLNDAEKILLLGDFYLGIGGVLTFKNGGIDSVVKELPLDCMILETDSPYLAPVPHRGKRNESAYIKIVAEKLAELKGISLVEVAEITTQNAKNLFKL